MTESAERVVHFSSRSADPSGFSTLIMNLEPVVYPAHSRVVGTPYGIFEVIAAFKLAGL